MLSPAISERLDRLVAAYNRGVFHHIEFMFRLGELVTADNLADVVGQLPADLIEPLKESIAFDNQRAVDGEHLAPDDSPFNQSPPGIGHYYLSVASILLESTSTNKRGLLGVVCLPSFQSEWAVRLFEPKRGRFLLVRTVADEPIWGSQNSNIQAHQHEAPLPTELAQSLLATWEKMLRRTRYPEIKRVGLDGVSYHFFGYGTNAGRMAGQIWSPDPNTAPGRLVALSHLLSRYTEADEGARQEVIAQVQTELDWFQNLA